MISRMRRVSSFSTNFKRRILPYIILVNMMISTVCMLVFNYDIESLFALIFPTLILSAGWLLLFRQLKIVYVGNDHFKVDHSIIYFKDLQTIVKLTFLRYRIYYLTEAGIKSFDLNIDPFLTPKIIEKIKKDCGL